MLERSLSQIRGKRLSPSEISVVASEILGDNAREVAADFFELLNHEPGEDVITNLLDLFRELATRSPTWGRILRKSVTKRGRCPKPLVPSVRQILDDRDETLAQDVRSVRDLLSDFERVIDERTETRKVSGVQVERKTTLFGSGRSRATVPITTELSDIAHMPAIASLTNDLTPCPDEVVLDFVGVEHVYVVGLAALAAWCKRSDVSPQVVNASDTTLRYLDVIGFTRASKGGISQYSESDPYYAMAMEQLVSESQAESVARKLVDIIDYHVHLSKTTQSGLLVVFAELIENIQRHAGASSVAFACAQVYPKKRKLTICVVDTGLGIAQSIRTGSNEKLIGRVLGGESPVRLACDPLVTSKPSKHSGYGLYVARELVVRNGGTFRVFSDREIFTCYRRKWRRMENLTTVPDPWKGCWIAMILDLDANIPLGDVYITLPPLPGTELQEFF